MRLPVTNVQSDYDPGGRRGAIFPRCFFDFSDCIRYPSVETLESLAGRTKLGFENVGKDNHQVLLEKAAKRNGVDY